VRGVRDAILRLVRCNFCSKERPEFRVHRLQSNQAICDHCLEWHLHALQFLGGAVPPGCQECGATWEHLCNSTPGVEVRMYVAPKDGIYQLLCARCIRPYTAKRSDLYRGTEFGKTLKL
jgi:hypothetical protein